MAGEDEKLKPKTDIRPLVAAGLAEAACILAGVLAFVLTGKMIWLIIGVVAGLGFSVPAVIRHLRQSKDNDRAAR